MKQVNSSFMSGRSLLFFDQWIRVSRSLTSEQKNHTTDPGSKRGQHREETNAYKSAQRLFYFFIYRTPQKRSVLYHNEQSKNNNDHGLFPHSCEKDYWLHFAQLYSITLHFFCQVKALDIAVISTILALFFCDLHGFALEVRQQPIHFVSITGQLDNRYMLFHLFSILSPRIF